MEHISALEIAGKVMSILDAMSGFGGSLGSPRATTSGWDLRTSSISISGSLALEVSILHLGGPRSQRQVLGTAPVQVPGPFLQLQTD